ncbi:hypothetical protein F3Y22_tig00110430pilonHSYRG00324 [Hibiscus syriacus]|uniref:RanBD1 domain-containing protein n=1 Tax=Hibiscus syriacus TaxID=106335 RepID=A0A6A3AKK4_HIBSY|nr:hypothetical protein F3Y22_tig00110430pilonHSYRG00324 [Hibiscus syriacus]
MSSRYPSLLQKVFKFQFLSCFVMGDAENTLPPSKKRAAGREISRDNPGLEVEEDSSEQENGTFKWARDEVLANRRIVKVCKNQTSSAASSNPFSGILLVPPAEPTITPAASGGTPESGATTTEQSEETNDKDPGSVKSEIKNIEQSESKEGPVSEAAVDKESNVDKDSAVLNKETQEVVNDEKRAGDFKTKDEDKKNDETANGDNKDKSSENADSTAEGASLSSFQQLSSSQNAFTGLAGTGFSTSLFSFGSTPKDGSTSSVPLFGQPFGFGLSTNGNSSLFNASGASVVSKKEGSGGAWKERGKGELKVNVSTSGTEGARVVMRARGNYRLILNARLYPELKLTKMDKRGITFACMNSSGEEKEGLSTFSLKFKDVSMVEEFRAAVTAHKGNTAAVFKTPENSPEALEDWKRLMSRTRNLQ